MKSWVFILLAISIPAALVQGDTTDAEIQDITEQIWDLDVNNAGVYISIDKQGTTTSSATTDEAPDPLLTVDSAAFDIPTIAAMLPLYDNYHLQTNVAETITTEDQEEITAFLTAIFATDVMIQTRQFLTDEGLVGSSDEEWQDLIVHLWFQLFSRSTSTPELSSSGFEHVFIGELKGTTDVLGLHDWIAFYNYEQDGTMNYQGYEGWQGFSGGAGGAIEIRMDFEDIEKPTDSLMIGPSPELQIAYYTICFLARPNTSCYTYPQGNKLTIITYTLEYDGETFIGTAYPSV